MIRYDTKQSLQRQLDVQRRVLADCQARIAEIERQIAAIPDDGSAAHIAELVRRRDVARTNRHWADADALRDELRGYGVDVKDAPASTS